MINSSGSARTRTGGLPRQRTAGCAFRYTTQPVNTCVISRKPITRAIAKYGAIEHVLLGPSFCACKRAYASRSMRHSLRFFRHVNEERISSQFKNNVFIFQHLDGAIARGDQKLMCKVWPGTISPQSDFV